MTRSLDGLDQRRTLHAALSEVARGLARAHGQRQFYALAGVQSQLLASGVAPALSPWVFAAFVAREDFDAFFAMRETPGTYAELRAAMSASVPREAVPDKSFETLEGPLEDLGGGLIEFLHFLAEVG